MERIALPDGYLEKQHFSEYLRNSLDEIVSFSGICKSYSVCLVDAVNSTRITSQMKKDEVCMYYSIFLNSMAIIAKEFGASIVKNIGDSLLYYFPKTSNMSNTVAFSDTIECGLIMIEEHNLINEKMNEQGLPKVDYRISADYGGIMTAKSGMSVDIFGSSVNICAKINRMALPNGMVVGGDLYQIVKPFEEYEFRPLCGFPVGLKLHYPVYSTSRQTNR